MNIEVGKKYLLKNDPITTYLCVHRVISKNQSSTYLMVAQDYLARWVHLDQIDKEYKEPVVHKRYVVWCTSRSIPGEVWTYTVNQEQKNKYISECDGVKLYMNTCKVLHISEVEYVKHQS
jgi:hypothetical protein